MTRETSYGFKVIDFARDVLNHPLDPWQEWLIVHAGELQEDGLTPRFQQVLTLVSRQNGKTELLVVLSLYWLYCESFDPGYLMRRGTDDPYTILGTSSTLGTAKESWNKAIRRAERVPALVEDIRNVRRASGEEALELVNDARYKISAANEKGGRGLTIDKLIMDELREHHDWEAYDAAKPTTTAMKYSQIWMISNQGDFKSVVLTSLREQAINGTDKRLGIFEWSAPDGAPATDVEALAMANPNLGHRISLDSLIGDAIRAEAAGGEQLTGFLTEHQCRYVPMLNPAINSEAWARCLDPGTLEEVRNRVALCLDVSLDGLHATLYAAATLTDGRVRVEPVAAWSGRDCTTQLTRELDGWLRKIRPRTLGWFPGGPAAALAAELHERDDWPPASVEVAEIRGEVPAICMGFSAQVDAHQIAHSGDPLLDAHIAGAEKLTQGDSWRFTRRGVAHVDAAYAAAGAVHLARLLAQEGGPPSVRWLS